MLAGLAGEYAGGAGVFPRGGGAHKGAHLVADGLLEQAEALWGGAQGFRQFFPALAFIVAHQLGQYGYAVQYAGGGGGAAVARGVDEAEQAQGGRAGFGEPPVFYGYELLCALPLAGEVCGEGCAGGVGVQLGAGPGVQHGGVQ